MSGGIDVHSESGHISVALDLGELRSVNVRSGCDGESYAEIRCAYGRINLTAGVLLDLSNQGREAFVAAVAKKRGRR